MGYTKHLETIKSREARINYISSAIDAHKYAMNGVVDYHKKFIQDSIDKMNAEYKFLNETKRWNFNFKSGGWNSVTALTKEQAIIIANEQYNSSPYTQVDENTFRIESEADNKALLSLFY